MNTQQTETIDSIVNEFAQRIARTIVSKTIEELFSGRLAAGAQMTLSHEVTDPAALLRGEAPAHKRLRRSGQDIEKGVAAIVAALLTKGGRMGAEDLREATGMSKAELLGPLKKAIASGQVSMQGQRRGATYGLPGKVTVADSAGDKVPATSFAGRNVIRRKKSK